MTAPCLTFELLDDLLDRAERFGKPDTRKALNTGLSQAKIDEIMAPLGLALPLEARTLWQWRDGCEARSWLYPGRYWPTLAEAVTIRDEQLQLASEDWDDRPDDWWPNSYFPIIGSENIDAIDCADPAAQRSPVHKMWLDQSRDDSILNAHTRSIGEMVTWWIEAYDAGARWFDRNRNCWAFDESKIPSERRHIA